MHSVTETHQSRTTAQHNAGTTWASDGVQVEIIRRLPHQRELREELHGLEEQPGKISKPHKVSNKNNMTQQLSQNKGGDVMRVSDDCVHLSNPDTCPKLKNTSRPAA